MPDENVTTPAGTEDDPYLATTWDELVIYASITDAYVKVANDIDILAEYPNGDAPTLLLNGYVDGNNKTISRWYCTGSRYLINTNATADKYIENAIFTNIKTNYSLIYNQSSARYGDHAAIRNCKFAGVMGDGYVFDGSSSNHNGILNGVVVNIKGNDLHLVRDYSSKDHTNCNITMTTSATWLNHIYASDRDQKWYDSQFDITAPNLTSMKNGSGRSSYDNCVLNIKTNNAVSYDTRNSLPSIFNKTSAPQMEATTNKMIAITDEHWLDAAWIASNTDFNIVAGE